MTGLQKICKMYGRMQCGDIMMAWDYAQNKAVPEAELKSDKKRWAASEKAKWAELKNCKDFSTSST